MSGRSSLGLGRLTPTAGEFWSAIAFLIYLAITLVADTLLAPESCTDAFEENDRYNCIYTNLRASPATAERILSDMLVAQAHLLPQFQWKHGVPSGTV